MARVEGGWSTSRVILTALFAVVSLGSAPTTPIASTTALDPFQTTTSDSVPHRKVARKQSVSSRARPVSVTTPSQTPPPSPAFTVTPLPNSQLPKNRIVVFYGNPLSKKMGVLGEYPQATMIAKLQDEVRKFQLADPSTPVKPGFHLIVSVAQGSPGNNGQ